jgi:thioredoxin reductase
MNLTDIKVAIIGAGPAGVGVAQKLHDAGINDVMIIERHAEIGGVPARYTDDDVPSFVVWSWGKIVTGKRLANFLNSEINKRSIDVRLNCFVRSVSITDHLIEAISTDGLTQVRAKAIILACGAREKSPQERDLIFGDRPARIYNSMQVLDLIRRDSKIPAAEYGILTSEDIAYAVAAKVAPRSRRNAVSSLIDTGPFPKHFMAKLFFALKSNPKRYASVNSITIHGFDHIESLDIKNRSGMLSVDYLIASGELVPNTELLAQGGYHPPSESRVLPDKDITSLEKNGVFLVGNIRGRRFGGYKAFLDGKKMAKKIIRYLSR